MEALSPLRRWAVVAVCWSVAALALLGTGFRRASVQGAPADPFGAKEEQVRLAPVLRRFPPQSALGIITDFRRNIDDTPLMEIRFVLAPRQVFVVEPNRARPEWAIGIFRDRVDPLAAGAALGYEVVQTFDTGLVLYHYHPQ
jgi:hypothetical protein